MKTRAAILREVGQDFEIADALDVLKQNTAGRAHLKAQTMAARVVECPMRSISSAG